MDRTPAEAAAGASPSFDTSSPVGPFRSPVGSSQVPVREDFRPADGSEASAERAGW